MLVTSEQDARLGLTIPPEQIRIYPSRDNVYGWSVIPQHQTIFQRNLSKLISREYKQIIKGIGVSIEAVQYGSINPSLVAPARERIGCSTEY